MIKKNLDILLNKLYIYLVILLNINFFKIVLYIWYIRILKLFTIEKKKREKSLKKTTEYLYNMPNDYNLFDQLDVIITI